jgi:hypothetical protein
MNQVKCWTGKQIKSLEPSHVFVFGSNPEGRHGLGAAKAAMQFGAMYGIGRGLCGQTYALVTKNLRAGYTERSKGITYRRAGNRSVSLEQIRDNVTELYECANKHPDKQFIVVYQMTGRNLNGYKSTEVIDQFIQPSLPTNVYFHESFRTYMNIRLHRGE